VVDPGVVPESPSWPNTALMMLAALLVSLVASLLYVILELNYRLEESAAPRSVATLILAKTDND